MNTKDIKYSKFALCNEMLETVEIVRNFDQRVSYEYLPFIRKKKKIFITGEGSSRIFPAKHLRYQLLKHPVDYTVDIDGGTQALEYNLNDYVVFGISNSGKTKELVNLFRELKIKNHDAFFGITATPDSPITNLSNNYKILSCGKENAVAATKSVVEEALYLESLYYNLLNLPILNLNELSEHISTALQSNIDSKIIETISKAPVIYFAGRNDGVAEELTLKTNEITRKKSVFLEGTYALHGIEEVMNKNEVMIVIEPFEQEEQKFFDVLVSGAGINVIAIASRETMFPTFRIPNGGAFRNYIELAAGWNILTEVGISIGIDLDTPVRARKIGNEGDINYKPDISGNFTLYKAI